MPKKKGKKGKRATKSKKSPSKKKQEKKSLEEEIKAYISSYIDEYMNYVEELNLNEADFPFFYTHYPFDVKAYILPDNSTCILFKGLAESTIIEIEKAEFESVDKNIEERQYDHICCYPSSHSYTQDESKFQAKKDVEQDIENTRSLRSEDIDGEAKEEALKSVRFMGIAVPFLDERRTSESDPAPTQIDANEFEFENLKMKEEEDFSSYSQRLKEMERAYFHPEEESPIEQEETEPTPEPTPEPIPESTPEPPPEPTPESIPKSTPEPIDVLISKKKAEEEEATFPPPPPPPPSAAETSKTTQIPIPPPGAPGTNISIEIKQPETGAKGEPSEAKREDILRLKKTLLTQTIELEDMKKKMLEIENKIGNVEHMRQTVFRMNRKVHDSDEKMTQLEKSNEDVLFTLDEMRSEQREENKKTRRFITEKAKKARNQALTVAIIAIIISALSLPFLIMLVIRYWDEIKSMLGL